ncbi:MAG TPA: hypothetical protein VKQ72_11445 [Aggregatilineales bacterium]|nr:hypothetical protein [Aggregatilineales bacterium]
MPTDTNLTNIANVGTHSNTPPAQTPALKANGRAGVNTEKAMAQYLEVYQSLYRRAPSELRDLGSDWVLVNGARMSLAELQQLTEQLQRELQQEQARKRNVVKRLLTWFGG